MPFLAAIPAWVGIAAAAVGAGVSAISAIGQGGQQQAIYKSQAQGARFNQQVMEENARAVENSWAYTEDQKRRQFARLKGTQEAMAGASGTTFEGTPLDIFAQTASDAENEIIAGRYNAAVQAARFRSQGNFAGYEAERQDNLGEMAMTPAYLKAGTALLSTAANLFSISGGGWGDPKVSGNSLRYTTPSNIRLSI